MYVQMLMNASWTPTYVMRSALTHWAGTCVAVSKVSGSIRIRNLASVSKRLSSSQVTIDLLF